MATKTIYPATGEPKKIIYDVISKKPEKEEVENLITVPMQKRGISKEETSNAILWFILPIIFGVALFFFGGWVIHKFRGPGVLIFGYGARFIAPPVLLIIAIVSLSKLFRSAQKKNPEDALKWVFDVSLFGDDSIAARFGKIEYAVSTMERILPYSRNIERDKIKSGIENFRKILIAGMEETTAKARGPAWNESGESKNIKIEKTDELYKNILEMKASVIFNDILTQSDNNNLYRMITAILELHIDFIMVKSGDYWYPYDIFPEITRRT